MPLDREATLKQAEKLIRQGKLDGAIAEYLRLIEDQPHDWNAINTLGDLYVRAGDVDHAVAQFVRIADHLSTEGFFPKAAALYKKALKIKGDDEHTLLRLSEIAAQQGLLADARAYLRQLGRQRRDRGDNRGAADCLIRLASLDEADAETKVAGARAAQAIGQTAQAGGFFRDAADEFEKAGRKTDALDALGAAAALDPSDIGLRGRLAREYVAAGQLDRARAFLTRESAGSDPDLVLALGRIELAAGNEAEARSIFTRLIAIAPHRSSSILGVADELARGGSIEAAYSCVDIVVDDSLLAGDWDRGIAALQAFLTHGAHIPALLKLVELAVDSGRVDLMHEVQPRLADAYLGAGRGAEARVIAEDLVSRDPRSERFVHVLRRALDLQGVDDADAIIARYREPEADRTESSESSSPHPQASPTPPADDTLVFDMLEIDLTDALAKIGARSPDLPPPIPPSEEPVKAPQALESVFEEMRARVHQGGDVGTQYERALQHLEGGRLGEAIADLQGAARTPVFRFKAASRLGRLYIANGEMAAGIEWLERAAEAPSPSPDEGYAVLYDLAIALDKTGESARALAIFMEIDADGTTYRDVRGRIEQLMRAQAGSPGT